MRKLAKWIKYPEAKKELYEIISERTGQKFDKVYRDCERDYWLSATESLDYGLIDSIVKSRKK